MRVLIVEDAAFNAFCLSRILESAIPFLFVTVVPNSTRALQWIQKNSPDLIIIDGDLGAHDGSNCNGPALTHELLKINNTFSIISWTDSNIMRQDFANVYAQHGRIINDHNSWPKVVCEDRVRDTMHYYFGSRSNLRQMRG